MPARLLLLILIAAPSLHAAETKLTAKGVEFFEAKIRPVLSARCYACHSASSKELKAGLRPDKREGLLQGGESGAAVIPGDVAESLLIQAIKLEAASQAACATAQPTNSAMPLPRSGCTSTTCTRHCCTCWD